MRLQSDEECLIILNPAARRERARQRWSRALPASYPVKIAFSDEPGHAERLARQAAADGYRIVVAAGGDGTVNEVANGLVGTESALGVLPVGSVNVFARELGLPLRIPEAWKIVAEGRTRAIDLGRVSYEGREGDRRTRYFVQLAGAGLTAKAVEGVTREHKRAWGPLSYVMAGLRLLGERLPTVRLEVEGSGPAEGVCAIFNNGRFYGGPFTVSREARLDDGFLDVCVFQKGGFFNVVNYLQGIARGTHMKFSDVRCLRGKRVRVSSEGEVPFEADGEMLCRLPVEIELVPAALKVVVPEKSKI